MATKVGFIIFYSKLIKMAGLRQWREAYRYRPSFAKVNYHPQALGMRVTNKLIVRAAEALFLSSSVALAQQIISFVKHVGVKTKVHG